MNKVEPVWVPPGCEEVTRQKLSDLETMYTIFLGVHVEVDLKDLTIAKVWLCNCPCWDS